MRYDIYYKYIQDRPYQSFMVYEPDDSGAIIKLEIEKEQLQHILHPKKVLLIVKDNLKRIYIWKGPKSSVLRRFISLRAASTLQEELMKDPKYNRCKIVNLEPDRDYEQRYMRYKRLWPQDWPRPEGW